MKLLKEASIQLIIGLNVFILFLWLSESRVELPSLLIAAGRAHPLVLHFPIVLLILAVVVTFIPNKLGIDNDSIGKIRTSLYFGAALTAGLTAIFGLFLSKEDGYSGDVLEWHKWAGISTSLLAALLVWMDLRQVKPTITKATGAFALTILIATGHWGATLTHGDSFLTTPLLKNNTELDLHNAVVYKDLIVPVLREKCYSCHNDDKSKGELILTSSKAILNGGKSGALFVSGRSQESLLIKRLLLDVNHKHHMPPKGKVQLSDAEIALLSAWIKAGASFTAKTMEMKGSDSLYIIAKTLYGDSNTETFTFSPADEDIVSGFAGTEWVVTPVSFQSPGLGVVCFNRSGFSIQSMEKISAIRAQIVSLKLSGMPVNDAYLEIISSFPHLRHLNLNYTKISDQGLEKLSNMPELVSLMLTGTNVSEKGVERLTQNPNLNHIFLWNTAVMPGQVARMRQKHPSVRFEVGSQQDANEELTLNTPEISPSTDYFRTPFKLNITHPIHGTQLIYTLDGTSPDSTGAKVFNKPLLINSNTVVKAKAAKKGWKSSVVTERNFQRSAIRADGYALESQPHPLHKGKGAETLFDLTAGSTDILYASDGKWLGYKGMDMVVEIKFARPTIISKVTLSSLSSVALDAFPPALIQIWGADTSGDYKMIAEQKPTQPMDKAPVERMLISCLLKNKKPFSTLKLMVFPLAKMPGWHPKKGQPAWFFIDELLLN